jgi:hypothetical protein
MRDVVRSWSHLSLTLGGDNEAARPHHPCRQRGGMAAHGMGATDDRAGLAIADEVIE